MLVSLTDLQGSEGHPEGGPLRHERLLIVAEHNGDEPTPVHALGLSPDERLSILVDGAEEYALFLLDPRGTIVSWNVGAQHLNGYEEAEIVGRHFSVLYPDEDREAARPARQLVAATVAGRAEDSGWRVRKDGTRYWANVVLTAVRAYDGDLRGFAELARDGTDRLLADRQTQRAEHNAAVERIGVSLVDTVIRRVFSAGLELQSALELITHPEATRRVAGAIDQLDQAAQEVRAAVVGLQDPDR